MASPDSAETWVRFREGGRWGEGVKGTKRGRSRNEMPGFPPSGNVTSAELTITCKCVG